MTDEVKDVLHVKELIATEIIPPTDGTTIAPSSSQKVSFHGSTPVVKHSTTGQTAGFTAGSGTAVLDDSTFTGGSGTKAYTIGDIVLALKGKGLLTGS